MGPSTSLVSEKNGFLCSMSLAPACKSEDASLFCKEQFIVLK